MSALPTAATSEVDGPGPRDQVSILIVDDLSDKLLAMRTVLEELGQTLVCVQSGREALRRVIDQDFAVILLDVNMPDMSGLETAQLIRAREKSRHTPIIFITAFPDEVAEVEVYTLGAVDYIMSPVVPQILRSKVGVFVDLYRKREHIRRQADERIQLAREQTARQAAEEAQRRASFLAETSAVLSRSLDLDETLESLARAVVPALAGEVVVTLANEPSGRGRAIRARRTESGEVAVAPISGLDGLEPRLATAVRRVLTTGRLELVPDERVRLTGLVAPISLRGRTLGAMSLWRSPAAGGFGLEERVIVEEVTSRAAHAIENARLYRDIQDSDHRKNEFLAMLAHELRNPLAPITAAVELLRTSPHDAQRVVTSSEIIGRQARQLARLIDDLLDVARITSGKIRMEMTPQEIAPVVAHAVEASRPLMAQRHQSFRVELPDDLRGVRVLGDQTRLSQVLSNLLNNAAKYTDEGGHIELILEGGREGLVIRVRDTGTGLTEDMIAVIFDLFAQVDRALDRAQGGLGIGLTIVRRLVELHGGTVEARSEGLGRGSEFVVRLPTLADASTDPTTAASTPPSAAPAQDIAAPSAPALPHEAVEASRGARVLVVDDNEDAAEMLAELLRLSGHEVVVCHDGLVGLSLAETQKPEFALLDVGLPGLDGYELARRIRAQPALAEMVLVAITGYGQESDKQRSKAVGFNHHLVKPVNPDVLTSILDGRRPQA